MKILCIILSFVLLFCACGKEEIIESSGQLQQITNGFEADEEKINHLVCIVPGVRSVRTDEPWGVYKGFSDPAEISSDGLLNFFFYVANPDDYYNEADETYRFSENDVCMVLSEYFTDFNFIAEESGFSYDEEKGFILSGFCGHDLPKASFKVDEYSYDEQTGIISVKGSQMELGDDTVPSGNTFSMEILVEGENYLIKSYFYNAVEEDVPYINGWTADFKPSDFENIDEYYEAFLDEYVKKLEPTEYFETDKDYPSVILEIFNIIMEQETLNFLKCKELLQIEVFGDKNEFYSSYFYVTNEGAEEVLKIRMRRIEDGKYGLLLRGGGAPGGHGLEKTDITLEDIR